jgi:ribosomal-protein-alanine N-acetyltransferase
VSADNILRLIPEFALLESRCFSEPWSEQTLTASFLTGQYIFASVSENEVVAGYACGTISPGEGEVQRICVLPEFRRRGFAKRLLDELAVAFTVAGCETVFLEVRSKNIAARELYKKAGFEEIGVRPGYYGDDDAVICRRG